MASSSASQLRPWDVPPDERAAPASERAWDAGDYDPEGESDTSSEPDPLENKHAAATEFLDVLTDLYSISQISAQHFAVLCYWAAHAGMPGLVHKYGMKPGLDSGNYQKHLDRAMGINDVKSKAYSLDTVGNRMGSVERATMSLPIIPLHEAIDSELREDDTLLLKLQEALDESRFPMSYESSPIVAAADGPVWPISLFLDGVPYSLTDTVVGIWAISLVTNRRHLLGVVRKRCSCKCGCRGWCTWWPLLDNLRWSLEALADGRYPTRRHDGTPFGNKDEARAAKAGTNFVCKAALVHLKGDWAEFCERMGFPSHASNIRPCFSCNCTKEDRFETEGITLDGGPWSLNTDADFEEAIRRCEKTVVLSENMRNFIVPFLVYDKRPGALAGRGRVLNRDINDFGLRLRKGDRLEPCPSLPDVGEFEFVTVFPLRVVFWSVIDSTLAYHRSPLWIERLGVTPTRCIALDLLHCFYLGPMHNWSKFVVWRFLQGGIWGNQQPTAVEAHLAAVAGLKAELKIFYAQHRNKGLTKVTDLTVKMLGTASSPALKTKAMETYGICLWLVQMLRKYRRYFDDYAALLESGGLLLTFIHDLKRLPNRVAEGDRQALLDTWKRFMVVTRGYDIDIPKTHQVMHVVQRMHECGNPLTYTTFEDEGLNKVLKKVLRNCHQGTLEMMALAKMGDVLRRRSRKRPLA